MADLRKQADMADGTCARCPRVDRLRRGLCSRCHKRASKAGDLPPKRRYAGARLEAWVASMAGVDGCWPWPGKPTPKGYAPRLNYRGRTMAVHTAVWEIVVGPAPRDGSEPDHQCHNEDAACPGGPECPHRRCCRPDHLKWVSKSENSSNIRNPRSAKTHCPQGHPYSGGNLYIDPSNGGRVCRTCVRNRNHERQRAEQSEFARLGLTTRGTLPSDYVPAPKPGSENGHAVLTEDQVGEIRRMCAEKLVTQTEIARMFGVARSTVSMIKHRRCWTHI